MTETGASQTERIAATVDGLVALVRSAPPETIRDIADGDSYARPGDNERHFRALREVIETFECRLDRQPDNHWYPREPVELVSYGVDGHDSLSVCTANALLMISDLETDRFDYMGFRWDTSPGAGYFEALPPRLRTPLMNGFEVLRARWAQNAWQ